jgi:hypothetical protein
MGLRPKAKFKQVKHWYRMYCEHESALGEPDTLLSKGCSP